MLNRYHNYDINATFSQMKKSHIYKANISYSQFYFVCFRGSNFHPGFKLSPLHDDEVSKSKIKIHDIS